MRVGHYSLLALGFCVCLSSHLSRVICIDKTHRYGLLDTLNAKFQADLNVTAAKAGGLQAAYFGYAEVLVMYML